jgi:hypothetical protein
MNNLLTLANFKNDFYHSLYENHISNTVMNSMHHVENPFEPGFLYAFVPFAQIMPIYLADDINTNIDLYIAVKTYADYKPEVITELLRYYLDEQLQGKIINFVPLNMQETYDIRFLRNSIPFFADVN